MHHAQKRPKESQVEVSRKKSTSKKASSAPKKVTKTEKVEKNEKSFKKSDSKKQQKVVLAEEQKELEKQIAMDLKLLSNVMKKRDPKSAEVEFRVI